MEGIDWMTVFAVGLAIAVFTGGMLMMFTNVWTKK
jgi:hypothetical protein